jgi:hypothetical protein
VPSVLGAEVPGVLDVHDVMPDRLAGRVALGLLDVAAPTPFRTKVDRRVRSLAQVSPASRMTGLITGSTPRRTGFSRSARASSKSLKSGREAFREPAKA